MGASKVKFVKNNQFVPLVNNEFAIKSKIKFRRKEYSPYYTASSENEWTNLNVLPLIGHIIEEVTEACSAETNEELYLELIDIIFYIGNLRNTMLNSYNYSSNNESGFIDIDDAVKVTVKPDNIYRRKLVSKQDDESRVLNKDTFTRYVVNSLNSIRFKLPSRKWHNENTPLDNVLTRQNVTTSVKELNLLEYMVFKVLFELAIYRNPSNSIAIDDYLNNLFAGKALAVLMS